MTACPVRLPARRRHLGMILSTCVAMVVSPTRLLAHERLRPQRSGTLSAKERDDVREQAQTLCAYTGASHPGDVAAVRPVLQAIARQRMVYRDALNAATHPLA